MKKKQFEAQYAPLYISRLLQLRPILQKAVSAAKETNVLDKIIDLKQGEDCIIIGTLFKEMPGKPNILAQLEDEEDDAISEMMSENLTTDKDKLVLEDESGRVTLHCESIDKHQYVTGIILAVEGKMRNESDGGGFLIDNIYSAGFPPQVKSDFEKEGEEDQYVAICSGLNVSENQFCTQLLVEYFCGLLGDAKEQEFVSKIARVIVAGNSISTSSTKDDIGGGDPIETCDTLFAELVTSVSVDLMPGSLDPSTVHIPQQPMHNCLFPKSIRRNTFTTTTNPYQAQFEHEEKKVLFLGDSGQNVQNIQLCSRNLSVMDIMQQLLNWRHLAPTAPDTLGCSPVSKNDPFVLENCPHVYFSGNHDTFETSIVTGSYGQVVRLISVPSFEKTKSIVLVNLKDLSCFPISIAP